MPNQKPAKLAGCASWVSGPFIPHREQSSHLTTLLCFELSVHGMAGLRQTLTKTLVRYAGGRVCHHRPRASVSPTWGTWWLSGARGVPHLGPAFCVWSRRCSSPPPVRRLPYTAHHSACSFFDVGLLLDADGVVLFQLRCTPGSHTPSPTLVDWQYRGRHPMRKAYLRMWMAPSPSPH